MGYPVPEGTGFSHRPVEMSRVKVEVDQTAHNTKATLTCTIGGKRHSVSHEFKGKISDQKATDFMLEHAEQLTSEHSRVSGSRSPQESVASKRATKYVRKERDSDGSTSSAANPPKIQRSGDVGDLIRERSFPGGGAREGSVTRETPPPRPTRADMPSMSAEREKSEERSKRASIEEQVKAAPLPPPLRMGGVVAPPPRYSAPPPPVAAPPPPATSLKEPEGASTAEVAEAQKGEEKRLKQFNRIVSEFYTTEITFLEQQEEALKLISDVLLPYYENDSQVSEFLMESLLHFSATILSSFLDVRNKEEIRNTPSKHTLEKLVAYLEDTGGEGKFEVYHENVSAMAMAHERLAGILGKLELKDFPPDYIKSLPEGMSIAQLPGIFITSVQRLPRYELLLRDIEKVADTHDKASLAKCLQNVKTVISELNEKKREHEEATARAIVDERSKDFMFKRTLLKSGANAKLLVDLCAKPQMTITSLIHLSPAFRNFSTRARGRIAGKLGDEVKKKETGPESKARLELLIGMLQPSDKAYLNICRNFRIEPKHLGALKAAMEEMSSRERDKIEEKLSKYLSKESPTTAVKANIEKVIEMLKESASSSSSAESSPRSARSSSSSSSSESTDPWWAVDAEEER